MDNDKDRVRVLEVPGTRDNPASPGGYQFSRPGEIGAMSDVPGLYYGPPMPPAKTALDKQVAGDHYRKYKIQPVEFCIANELGFLAGNVIKYVCRYKDKGGAEDIKKARHYLDLILQFEYGQ